jgi:threonine/homoserine/homoserine lactone efflux protein
VRWAGAIYLIYLGIRLVISSFRTLSIDESGASVRELNPMLQGISTQLGCSCSP